MVERTLKNHVYVFSALIYYIIMVCEENCPDLNQERIKNACKIEIFPGKVLVVRKIVVPLHPLTRNTSSGALKERVL